MENYLSSKNQTSSDLKAIKKHSCNTLKTQHEIASIESMRQLNTCQNPVTEKLNQPFSMKKLKDFWMQPSRNVLQNSYSRKAIRTIVIEQNTFN